MNARVDFLSFPTYPRKPTGGLVSVALAAIPDFIFELRQHVGHAPLWLPGVTAVVRRDDEVLLVRRADNGEWTPVTGILDPGEQPAVAAAREVLEETGAVVTVERLSWVNISQPVVHVNGDKAQYLDHCFLCMYAERISQALAAHGTTRFETL